MKKSLFYLSLFVVGVSALVGCTTSSGGSSDPEVTAVYYSSQAVGIDKFVISTSVTSSVAELAEVYHIELNAANDDIYYVATETLLKRLTAAGVSNDVETATGFNTYTHLFYANSKIYFWENTSDAFSALMSDIADGSSSANVVTSDAIGTAISGLGGDATNAYFLEGEEGGDDLLTLQATLIDGVATVNSTIDVFASVGVTAFDKATGKWYVYDTDANEISMMNVDGTGLAEVVTGLTTELTALAVYNGTVFYAVDTVLYSATGDTDKTALVTADGSINSIALDYE